MSMFADILESKGISIPEQSKDWNEPTTSEVVKNDSKPIEIVPNPVSSKLTNHQAKVIVELLNNTDRVKQLTGGAGFGKSFVLSQLKYYLPTAEIAYTATTNNAVANMSKFGIEATTIHKHSGLFLKKDLNNNRLIKKSKFEEEVVDVLVIDESSYITSELYGYILSSSAQLIILVGDPIQLKLDSFDLSDIPSFELLVSMRQRDTDTNLFKALTSLRESIDTKLYKFIRPKADNSVSITNDLVSVFNKDEEPNKIMLTYTNKNVTKLNSLVKDSELYKIGNVVENTEPIIEGGEVRVATRTVNTITSYIEKEDYHLVGLNNLVEVRVAKDVYALVDELKELREKSGRKAWLRESEKYNTLHLLHSRTVHSSQGMSINNVYVNLEDIVKAKDNKDLLYRLTYVAMSRARKKVILMFKS